MGRRTRKLWSVLAAAGVGFMPTGCSSVATRLYDSDRHTSAERQKKCLCGIPITLDVPTHVKVMVTETRYYYTGDVEVPERKAATETSPPPREAGTAGANTSGAPQPMADTMGDGKPKDAMPQTPPEPKLTPPPAPAIGKTFRPVAWMPPTRSMQYDIVTRKELFTVDFKRPAAGINDLKIEFSPTTSGGQYFKSIKQDVTDVTIDKVAGLVEQIIRSAPVVRGLSTSALGPNLTTNVIAVPHVVAVEFFDIHQPGLEERIRQFVDRYVNDCSPACHVGRAGGHDVPLPPS